MPNARHSVNQALANFCRTEETTVCREACASLHSVEISRLRRIARAVLKFETPQDNRGRRYISPRSETEELKSKINDHIMKFRMKNFISAMSEPRKQKKVLLVTTRSSSFRQLQAYK